LAPFRRASGKQRSIERIDPIVAVVIAVDRSLAELCGIYADGRALLIVGA